MKTSLANENGINVLINPAYDIGQRNLNFLNLTTPQYTLDRWYLNHSALGLTFDVDRVLDSPIWSNNLYSMKVTNKAIVAKGANGFIGIRQPIEGYNIRRLRNKDFMVNFNIKSSIAGIYSVLLISGGQTAKILKSITVNSANTWEHKSIRVAKMNESLGGFTFEEQNGMELQFILQSGTSFATTENVWTSANIFGAVNQIDFGNVLNATFQLNDISVHEGIEEIDFNLLSRSYAQEFNLCQRYYETSYKNGLPKGTTGANGYMEVISATADAFILTGFKFQVEKRVIPLVETYSPDSGALNTATRWAGASDHPGGMFAVNVSKSNIRAFFGNTTPFVGGAPYRYHYTADAEL